MSAAVDPKDALQQAVAALAKGRFDGKSADGVKANALESIAWSLAGILATLQGADAPAVARPKARRAAAEPIVKLRET